MAGSHNPSEPDTVFRYSRTTQVQWHGMDITLLDTPGHVDFSAEMERTLQVLDYAVLVISAADGLQGHVMTLWRLLERYRVPLHIGQPVSLRVPGNLIDPRTERLSVCRHPRRCCRRWSR